MYRHKGETMADIYCPRCGEPWDVFELHDVEGKTFDEASAAFKTDGCGVFDGVKCEPNNSMTAMVAAAVMDLSEYPDDWAADMDLVDML